MEPTERQEQNSGCGAITIKGKPCKNHRAKGSRFCGLHRLSRRNEALWYQNSVVQTCVGVGMTILVGWYFFFKGPTVEKQEEGLTLQREGLTNVANIQNGIVALFVCLREQSMIAGPPEFVSHDLDLTNAIRQAAAHFGVSSNEIAGSFLKYIAENKNSADLSGRGKAEFLDKNYFKSVELLKQAAAEKFKHQKEIVLAGVADLELGGEAYRAVGRFSEALGLFDEAIGHVSRDESPEMWGTLWHFVGACHYDLAMGVNGEETKFHLDGAVSAYRSALTVRTNQPQQFAITMGNLGSALNEQADCAQDTNALTLLREAIGTFDSGLTACSQTKFPQQWAMIQLNYGAALRDNANRSEGGESPRLINEAVAAYRNALKIFTRAEFPKQWAAAKNNLANALIDLAHSSNKARAERLLEEAVSGLEETLAVRPNESFPDEWARTQNNLGNALADQADRTATTNFVPLMNRAASAYESALKVYTRDRLPRDFALTQNNLGNNCAKLANSGMTSTNEAIRLLDKAIRAFHAAMGVYTFEHFPQYWAWAQNNLGNALRERTRFSEGTEFSRLCDEAVAAHTASLKVFTREHSPQDWATAQSDLGNALIVKANQTNGKDCVRLCTNALEAFHATLEVYTEIGFPQEWATAQSNLGDAFRVIAQSTDRTGAEQCLREATRSYGASLRVFSEEQFPAYHEAVSRGLQMAEAELQKLTSTNPDHRQ
jgi:tetratricopeptide (TPR) repeat protein